MTNELDQATPEQHRARYAELKTRAAERRSAPGGYAEPAGIDIGADGPPEIALSILAELVSVVRGGSAGSLMDRPGPLHPGLGPGEATCPTG